MSNPTWLPGVKKVLSDFISLFCCLTTRSLDVERNVSTAYCKSSSGDGVDWLWHSIIYHGGLLWMVHFDPAIVPMYHGFPSHGVGWFFVRRWFRCFLIVGIHASGISAPLSLLMFFGSSLMWIASFSFLVYQCLSRSISLVSFHSGLCPVPLAFLKPRNSECVRVIYHCRVLSFFLAWIVLFPRCRLCRMCIVSCRLRHLACLDQRGLFVWPAEILVWCRI